MPANREFNIRHDLWNEIEVPSFPEIPTMISDQERRYLYWLAKEFYTGEGRIVEAGTWLGGSSACLAAGLHDAGSREILHCYDNYVWMKAYESRAGGIILPEGGDFQPKFKQLIHGRFSNVKSTKAQLSEVVWSGGPIEVLFLDAPKNKADMILAIKAFFPSLIPGFSIVVFQDFLYSPAYEVPATVCAIDDVLTLVHTVENSSTAAFRVNKDLIMRTGVEADYEAIPLNTIVNKMSQLMVTLPQQAGDFLAVSLAFLVHDRRSVREAIEIIHQRKLGVIGKRRLKFLGSMGHVRRKYAQLFIGVGV